MRLKSCDCGLVAYLGGAPISLIGKRKSYMTTVGPKSSTQQKLSQPVVRGSKQPFLKTQKVDENSLLCANEVVGFILRSLGKNQEERGVKVPASPFFSFFLENPGEATFLIRMKFNLALVHLIIECIILFMAFKENLI